MEMINVLEKNVSKKIAKNIMRLISVIRRDSSEISCQINISKVEPRLVVITTVWHDIVNNEKILLGVEVRTRSCRGVNDKVMYSKTNGKEKIEIIKS